MVAVVVVAVAGEPAEEEDSRLLHHWMDNSIYHDMIQRQRRMQHLLGNCNWD